MDKDDLLKICRYYKNEEHPQTHDAGIHISWSAERAWIRDFQDGGIGRGIRREILSAYIAAGLVGFRQTDDIPVHLKAYLFQSFCHYAERTDIDEFKKFYDKYYNENR